MRRRGYTFSAPATPLAPRRVVIRSTDVLVIGGYEVSADILKEVITPGKRLLWSFVANGADVRPVCYDETRVIWLSEEDLSRKEA